MRRTILVISVLFVLLAALPAQPVDVFKVKPPITLQPITPGRVKYQESFALGDVRLSKEQDYLVVKMDGLQDTELVGAPRLPVKYVNLIIPPGTDVDQIRIKTIDKTFKMPREFYSKLDKKRKKPLWVLPCQPPEYPSIDWVRGPFVKPDRTYYSMKVFPERTAEVVNHGYFDGNARIVTLALYPLSYEPQKHKLTLHTTIWVGLTFSQSKQTPLYPARRSIVLQQKYDTLLRSIVANQNPTEIQSYYNPPKDLYEPTGVSPIPVPDETGIEEEQPRKLYYSPPTAITPDPKVAEYMIVAPEDLLPHLEHFIKWKRNKGLNVRTVSLEWLWSNYSQGDQVVYGGQGIPDLAGSVRQYLFDQYMLNGLVYALLVGDGENFPIRYGCGRVDPLPPASGGPYNSPWRIPTEMYFSDFNGNWNVDNDVFLGEPYSTTLSGDNPDYLPEIFVGRLLIEPLSKGGGSRLADWTEKLISYESNPGHGDRSYLTKALFTRSDICSDFVSIDSQLQLLLQHEFMVSLLAEDYPEGPLASPTGSEVVTEMNKGYGLVSFNNHGAWNCVAVATTGENTYPKHWVFSLDEQGSGAEVFEDGNGLDNLDKKAGYSINFSTSCDIGAYDWEYKGGVSMVRTFTSGLNGKGGPVMICNTRYGTSATSNMLLGFNQFLLGATSSGQPAVNNVGMALAGGKAMLLANKYENYSLNLFGDPEMPVWTLFPRELTLIYDHPNQTVQVLNRAGQPVSKVRVHFMRTDGSRSELRYTQPDTGVAKCSFDFDLVCATLENHTPVLQQVIIGDEGLYRGVDIDPVQH
ncbi:MAG: hypothetical protein K0B87_05565 [Candidatus Syntrophosphaera sp.]|nr:hypothetical protein [Candidatus Syntrophosphaera sp.]